MYRSGLVDTLVTHANMKWLGLTPLFGDHRAFMPPQLKTKQIVSLLAGLGQKSVVLWLFALPKWAINYHKVSSSNTFCLEALAGCFRLLMKGNFNRYVRLNEYETGQYFLQNFQCCWFTRFVKFANKKLYIYLESWKMHEINACLICVN